MSAPSSRSASRLHGLDLQVVGTPEDFHALEEEWRALAARDPVPLTGSHEFLSCWVRHRLRDAPLHTVVLRREGRCVGIAPLMVSTLRRAGLTISTGLYLTRNTYVPGARALIDPAHAPPVAAALVDHLTGRDRPWTMVRLNNLRPDDPLEREIRRRRKEGTLLSRREPSELAVRVEMPASWEEFERLWSTNRRRTIKKRGTRLAARRRVEILDLASEPDPGSGLEEAFSVARGSWQGRQGSSIASSEESRSFYRALCEAFAPRGDLFVRVLRVDGEPVAFDFSVRQGEVLYELKRGFLAEYGSHGVGAVTIASNLERFLAEGGRRVEFLHPPNRDKLDWGSTTEPHGRVTLFRRTAAGHLLWAWSRLESLRS